MNKPDIAQRPRIIDPEKTFQGLVSEVQKIAVNENAPGLIIGVSGTDSILAFRICAKAFENIGKPERVLGIHYGEPTSSFVTRVVPWLKQKAPESTLIIDSSIGDRRDGLRWGDMLDRSVVNLETGGFWPKEQNYWVVGTRNASEEALGTYSNISSIVSLQPIIDIWKSEVLQICSTLAVPKVAIQRSYIADCGCGNPDMDMIALNPEMVDAILMVRKGILIPDYLTQMFKPEDVKDLTDIIDRQIASAKFKKTIPYRPSSDAVVPASNSNKPA